MDIRQSIQMKITKNSKYQKPVGQSNETKSIKNKTKIFLFFFLHFLNEKIIVWVFEYTTLCLAMLVRELVV